MEMTIETIEKAIRTRAEAENDKAVEEVRRLHGVIAELRTAQQQNQQATSTLRQLHDNAAMANIGYRAKLTDAAQAIAALQQQLQAEGASKEELVRQVAELETSLASFKGAPNEN